jgi:hypothetical protein
MRSLLRTLWLFSLLAFSPSLRADEPIPLSILYAGPSGTEREKEFTAFLEQTFRKVDRVPLVSFTDEKADGHDVVIFDWDTVFPRDSNGKIIEPIRSLRGPKGAKVSESYDRPTVLIGAGARWQSGIFVSRSIPAASAWARLPTGSPPGTRSSARLSR